MKLTTKGKSLKELKEEYKYLFCNQNWYESESFYTEKPQAGEYEIELLKDFNKTYDEQLKKVPSDFDVAHPALVVELICKNFKENGERLCEDYYVRTCSLDSDGRRVDVGHFGSGGLSVNRCWDVSRYGNIGLSAARKLSSNTRGLETFENDLTLESAIEVVKKAGLEVIKKY